MKIAIVYPSAFSVLRVRRRLLLRLRELGHEVVVLCPMDEYAGRIEEELGARVVEVPFKRFLGPAADIRVLCELYRVFSEEQFDLVHNFTIKPNVLGAIAARAAGVKVVVGLVAGLGYAFNQGSGFLHRLLRQVAVLGYRIGFHLTDRVWVQNPDDLEFLQRCGALRPGQGFLIRGSGVDLGEFQMERYSPVALGEARRELGIPDNSPLVVMSSRPLISKGVLEYREMAEKLAERHPDVLFLMMGLPAGGSPEAISDEELQQGPPNFRWLGFREDADRILALSDIVVHPSFYREGVPRSLLEAMALEKPIVTTDHPGCRETVDDGVNGLLIAPRDVAGLTSATDRLLGDQELRRAFGRAGRVKAEKEFSEDAVAQAVIRDIYRLEVS